MQNWCLPVSIFIDIIQANRSCRIFNKPSRSYYKQHFSSKCEYSPQLWFVVFGSSHFIASTDIFNRDHQSRLVVRKASYLFWFYLWLVGVDPTIQITREMIGDEQLSITAGSCFKCIADFIFLLQWRRFISGFLQPRSLLTSMLHMKFWGVNLTTANGFSLETHILSGWNNLAFSGSKENVSFLSKLVNLYIIESLSSWLW